MSEKSRTRTSYAPEEKAEIIMAVLTRKTTIQKVAKEKNVAPTLISLWKKQAEDAILERFTGTRPGRRKVEIDYYIYPAIYELNRKGYETVFCCAGHEDTSIMQMYIKFRDDVKEELRVARIAARTAKTRATRLEGALKTAKARISELEQGVRNMAAAMGCKLAKAKRPRRSKD